MLHTIFHLSLTSFLCRHLFLMSGNANEDCYPQEKKQIFNIPIEERGLNYISFSAILFTFFTLLCCMMVFFCSRFHKQERSTSTLTRLMQEKIQDDDYALSRVGKDSVYSYFVTNLLFGWLCAFVTLAPQVHFLRAWTIAHLLLYYLSPSLCYAA